MRFAPTIPPVTAPAEEEQPRPLRAVRPVRRVEPRMRVPLVFQRFARKAEPALAETGAVPIERRRGPDRRKWCRRLKRVRYLLNTRCGVERRKEARRGREPAATLDEEV